MNGPQLKIVDDKDWEQHLADAKVETWYHTPKKGLAILAPGAYSAPDNEPGASGGDRITSRRAEWEQACRAARKMLDGAKANRADMPGFLVLEHEFSHCYLPLPYTGLITFAEATPKRTAVVLAYEGAQQRYSHPDKAVPAVLHAFGCGFQANSFTRVLRWFTTPEEVRAAFLSWVDVQVKAAEVGI